MFYLLDTNVCIHTITKKEKVQNKIFEVGLSNCFIAEATIAELYYGVYKSIRFQENHRTVSHFIENINIIKRVLY